MRRYQVIAACQSACAAVILALFIGVAVAQSQENSAPGKGVPPELVSLTDQIVSKVPETDRSGVLVLDFKGPDEAWLPFGAWLADQFSLALAKSGQGFEIVDRSKLAATLDAQHLSPKDSFSTKVSKQLANILGARTVVMGSFGTADNGIGITLAVQPVSQVGDTVPLSNSVSGKIPLTGAVANNLDVLLASLRPKDGVFTPDEGGVGTVECISCPRPDWPDSFLPKHPPSPKGKKPIKGDVRLTVVVTAAGDVANIEIVKVLEPELDEAAITAVRRWKLKPAVDIDGNPVPVHQLMVVHWQ
jgi:TonB family protein